MEFSVAADSKKNDILLAKVRAHEDTSISRKLEKKLENEAFGAVEGDQGD